MICRKKQLLFDKILPKSEILEYRSWMLCILYLNSTSCCIEITEACKDMIYNYVIGLSSGVRRKFPMGAKVLSQLCDVTNQLGECRKNKNYRVVRGHALGKFRKIIPNSTHFRTGQIGSFSKTKKAFAYASKSRANPEYSRKTSFAFAKTAWFCFIVFHF